MEPLQLYIFQESIQESNLYLPEIGSQFNSSRYQNTIICGCVVAVPVRNNRMGTTVYTVEQVQGTTVAPTSFRVTDYNTMYKIPCMNKNI
jgi:hypothetical protein